MRKTTRFKFNAFMTQLAKLNGIESDELNKKFSVEPSVTQRLMTRVQESSEFLKRINIIPVDEMKGEKIGVGVSSTIASTTNTSGGDQRETADFTALDAEGYFCQQTNYDFHWPYNKLDLWARYNDFQTKLRDAIIQRQALDRILIGFNGVMRAPTSNRIKYPLLQDVGEGWMQKYRRNASKRVLGSKLNDDGTLTPMPVKIGKGDRDAYTGVSASWLHTKDPKQKQAKAKVKLQRKPKFKQLRALQHPAAPKVKHQAVKSPPKPVEEKEGEYLAGSEDNVFSMTTVFASKKAAMRAAQAKWEKLQRGVAEFSINLAKGRANLFPETPVRVQGFKEVIDAQPWMIAKVIHNVNSSGYTTALNLEVLLKDVSYEEKEEDM